MRIPGAGRARRAVRRVLGPYRRGALILAYHRVGERHRDPFLLNVSPRHFAEHLEVLRRECRPLPLRRLAGGTPPRRSVVVTLDDGYADNLREAKPLLDRADVPATVFVVSGAVGRKRGFWWDTLETALLEPTSLPAHLELPFPDGVRRWALPAHPWLPGHPSWRAWHVYGGDPPSPRHAVMRELSALLRPLANGTREEILDRLAAWAKAPVDPPAGDRVLDETGVRMLAAGGLVDVGAHTMSHPVLSTLADDEQEREIGDSKKKLEEILGAPVGTFAYPHGAREDYTPHSVAAVRRAGFALSCSNFPGMATRGTNPFELPRHLVYDYDGDELARNIRRWWRE